MRVAAACIVGLVAIASVADASAQGLSYGAKGGVTLGDLNATGDDQAGPFDLRIGFAAGGFVSWPLGGRLDFQPEVLFVQKGAKSDVLGGSATQKLDYLDVPLLVSYRINGSRERNFSVFGGPSVGILLRARSASTYGGDTLEQDVKDEVKSTDFAAVAGLAYHRGRVVFDGRYSWGFTDIDKDETDATEIRNRVISFLIGWRF
jgi:outer membrane immunogenic protein